MSQSTGKPAENTKESTAYQWFALGAILLGTFIAVLDNSLMNVALPKLISIFGSTTKDIEWVVTGYMLASAVVVPMSGFLADRFGYKTTFLFTVTAFTIGSLLCGLAWSDTSLIVFRVIQGLGGGFIMPLGMAMIYQIVPREKIQVALGVFGIAAMAAPAVGPTLSGYLIEHLSWRYLFFINLPIGMLAVVIGYSILKETPRRENLKFDVSGAILSMLMFGTLLLALTDGQSEGWGSLYIVTLFFISFFSFLLLLWVETGKDNPILDIRLFKNPTFTISTICSCFVMIGLQGGIFLMPLYLQTVQGLSPMQTGLVLMPQSIAMAVMMPVSGKLVTKIGIVPLGMAGLFILGTTTIELHRLTMDTPTHWIDTVLVLRGIGIGLCMMPISSAAMNALPNEMIARASALSNLTRNVMASFGIAVLTSIMTNKQAVYSAKIAESIQGDTPAMAQFQSDVIYRYMELGADLASAKQSVFILLSQLVQKEALARALADTMLVSAIPALFSIVFVFFMAPKKDKSVSAKPEQSGSSPHVIVEM